MLHILFVDNDPDIIRVAKEMFIQDEIDCIICDTCGCAMLAISNLKINAIVLDMKLEGKKTGMDLLNHLRSIKSKIPVIVTSGPSNIYETSLVNFNVIKLKKPYSSESLMLELSKINKNIIHF